MSLLSFLVKISYATLFYWRLTAPSHSVICTFYQSFEFYQLVEPQATVLCSHHSLLEAARRWSKTRFPSHPTWYLLSAIQTNKVVRFTDLLVSRCNSRGSWLFLDPGTHLIFAENKALMKKTGGPQAFQVNQIQKSSKLSLEAKHRHFRRQVPPYHTRWWCPWNRPACCSITS